MTASANYPRGVLQRWSCHRVGGLIIDSVYTLWVQTAEHTLLYQFAYRKGSYRMYGVRASIVCWSLSVKSRAIKEMLLWTGPACHYITSYSSVITNKSGNDFYTLPSLCWQCVIKHTFCSPMALLFFDLVTAEDVDRRRFAGWDLSIIYTSILFDIQSLTH